MRSRSSRSDRSDVSTTDVVCLAPGSAPGRAAPRRSSWRGRAGPRPAGAGAASPRSAGSAPRRGLRGTRSGAGMPRPSRAPRTCGKGLFGGVAGPHVQDDCDLAESRRVVRDEGDELAQQLPRQVVDAHVAEVFEELRGGGLAGAGEPAFRTTTCWGPAGSSPMIGVGAGASAEAAADAWCRGTAIGGRVPSAARSAPRRPRRRPRRPSRHPRLRRRGRPGGRRIVPVSRGPSALKVRVSRREPGADSS